MNAVQPLATVLPTLTPSTGPRLFGGLDLGQANDWSALAIVERRETGTGRGTEEYHVRYLHRWVLGVSYTAVVADLKALYATEPLVGTQLAVDATGCGRPVVDMLRDAKTGARLQPFTITAGHKPSGATVPKKDLVGGISATLASGRLRFAELPLTSVLQEELRNFKVKADDLTRSEQFGSWRDGQNDDIVLAVALALHIASRPPVGIYVVDMNPAPVPAHWRARP